MLNNFEAKKTFNGPHVSIISEIDSFFFRNYDKNFMFINSFQTIVTSQKPLYCSYKLCRKNQKTMEEVLWTTRLEKPKNSLNVFKI